MAQPSFEAFMWAISSQESGGEKNPYSAVNSYGAVGKYQVLKSNIPGWSKEVLGYSITWQKFRDSPDLQEKIVRGKLKKYYDKYGARGAASAWYSGNPSLDQSTRAQPGGPSIKSYVDSVISKAGGYKGGSSSGASTSSYSTAATTAAAKLSAKEAAEQYGYVAALMNSDPGLKKLFNQAVADGWTQQKFQAELRDTKWWKTHSQTERDFLVLKFGDPKTADQKLAQARVKVSQMAKQLGLTGPAASGANMSSYAYLMVAKGYDEAQIRSMMGQKITMGTGGWGGEAGQAAAELQSYGYSMGVKWSTSRLQPYLRNIVSGTATVQDVKNLMAKEAKASFPQWSKEIDGGQTVADLASPYMQSMSQILELPQGSVNLFDPTIKQALNYKNPTTLQSEAKPLWQFENEIRSDPRWRKTQNAQNSIMQVAHQVLADFGVKY